MQDATARLASDVKQFLDGKQTTTVSIGSFQGRTEASHSDGGGGAFLLLLIGHSPFALEENMRNPQ